eukprot:280-Hanusia_phi.AAC.2
MAATSQGAEADLQASQQQLAPPTDLGCSPPIMTIAGPVYPPPRSSEDMILIETDVCGRVVYRRQTASTRRQDLIIS